MCSRYLSLLPSLLHPHLYRHKDISKENLNGVNIERCLVERITTGTNDVASWSSKMRRRSRSIHRLSLHITTSWIAHYIWEDLGSCMQILRKTWSNDSWVIYFRTLTPRGWEFKYFLILCESLSHSTGDDRSIISRSLPAR